MTTIRNTHVLITGGARGIGRLLAERCLGRGAARVTLWDVDGEALNATVAEFSAHGLPIFGATVDLSDGDAIAAAAAALQAELALDILVNNAGIVCGKHFEEHSHDDIERSIRVNVLGVMHATRAFLPAMIARGHGHIVNMASASGYIPVPRLTVYASSKWACLGFSESLRVELQRHRGIHVTTVCPSYIKTGMFDGAKAPVGAPLLEPAYVADKIVAGIEGNRSVLRMPILVHLMPVLYHALPTRVFDFVLGRLFGIYGSMDQFAGHPSKRSTPGDRKT